MPNDTPTGFLFESIAVEGTEYRYAVYVPRDYDPAKPWPFIVFLNGKGECGTDGQKQLAVGLPTAIMHNAPAWPYVVLCPQKPDPERQWGEYDPAVMAMVDRSREEYHLDESRFYLTGLSQGGHGTWAIGGMHADLWAAIAPICGYGDPEALAGPLTEMPVWTFHGDADSVVPLNRTLKIVQALETAGGSPRVTIYTGVEHNSWDRAYRQENLAEWLLSHRRGTSEG